MRKRGTVIAEETGEFVQYGRKTRRKDSDGESTISRGSGSQFFNGSLGSANSCVASAFTGADALEQYLLCLQLVLRKQLRWLIDAQRLPEELEVRIRHVQLLYTCLMYTHRHW